MWRILAVISWCVVGIRHQWPRIHPVRCPADWAPAAIMEISWSKTGRVMQEKISNAWKMVDHPWSSLKTGGLGYSGFNRCMIDHAANKRAMDFLKRPKFWGLAWQAPSGKMCRIAESRMEDRKVRIKNRESRIEDRESRIENRESRIHNRESRIENRESRVESREWRVENRESRVKNREWRIEEPILESWGLVMALLNVGSTEWKQSAWCLTAAVTGLYVNWMDQSRVCEV